MFILLIALSLFIFNVNSDCTSSFSSNGGTLNLQCIVNKYPMIEFLSGSTYYNYSACNNNLDCVAATGGTAYPDVMIAQGRGSSMTDCAAYIAKWDSTVQPVYSSALGTWNFTYKNGLATGGCANGRWTNIVYQCDISVDPIDKTQMVVSEGTVNGGVCIYTLTIKSILACAGATSTICGSNNGGGGSSSDDSGISGGWVFIIILLCGFFLYCVIGYIWIGHKNEHGFTDVKNNVPNRSFWVLLPKYVLAGCGVTKDTIVGITSRGGGESDSKPLASNTAE